MSSIESDVISDNKTSNTNSKILKKQITCVGCNSNEVTEVDSHLASNSLNRTNSLCIGNSHCLSNKNNDSASASLIVNGDYFICYKKKKICFFLTS